MKKLKLILVKCFFLYLFFYAFIKYILAYTHKMEQKKSKLMSYYYACNQWLKNKNEGIYLADYLHDSGIHNIAVYGMGELGMRFCEELNKSNITIKYTIDQGGDSFAGVPNRTLNESLEDIELIIVTAIYDYDDIREHLLEKNPEVNVMSLENILLAASAAKKTQENYRG